MQVTLIFFFSLYLLSIVKASNDCVFEEKTWSTDGQLQIIPHASFEECVNHLVQSQVGKAMTFYGTKTKFENVCVIFSNLEGEHSCTDCISIKAGKVHFRHKLRHF